MVSKDPVRTVLGVHQLTILKIQEESLLLDLEIFSMSLLQKTIYILCWIFLRRLVEKEKEDSTGIGNFFERK